MWAGIAALAGTALSYLSGDKANTANKEAAEMNRDFTREMSNSAHQREMADLKAAGLNPILSGTGGQGASTPSAAMPTITAPPVNLPDFMAYGVSLKQLEQADQKLQNERDQIVIADKMATSNILKNNSSRELDQLDKILKQKGMPRAIMEGEASSMLHNAIKWLKNSTTNPKLPKDFDGATPEGWKNRKKFVPKQSDDSSHMLRLP